MKKIDANKNHIKKIIEYKRDTIFAHAENLSEEEINKIETYIKNNVPKEIENYKIIKEKEDIVGAFLVTNHLDGVLLDEIYIEKPYRNKGIGTKIIKDIQEKQNIIYLYVYKKNRRAINLYKKLDFQIIEETKTRYFMKYENRKKQEKAPI